MPSVCVCVCVGGEGGGGGGTFAAGTGLSLQQFSYRSCDATLNNESVSQ